MTAWKEAEFAVNYVEVGVNPFNLVPPKVKPIIDKDFTDLDIKSR